MKEQEKFYKSLNKAKSFLINVFAFIGGWSIVFYLMYWLFNVRSVGLSGLITFVIFIIGWKLSKK